MNTKICKIFKSVSMGSTQDISSSRKTPTTCSVLVCSQLAALVPPPHKNAVIYHGVLGANAALRSRVVPKPESECTSPALVNEARRTRHRRRRRTWSALLIRVFGIDGWLCPRCSKPMTLRVPLVGPPATTKILRDLQRSARGPPTTRFAAPRA